MVKIVINRCFGGFSLSPLATEMLAKRKGVKEVFFFKGWGEREEPVSREELDGKITLFWTAYSQPTPANAPDNWDELSEEEKDAWNREYARTHITSRPDDRADADLVAVVEELGDKANGACAELSIVEIPDGVDWQIQEYDGMEHIAEKHNTWR